jgi:hypothetical protein
MTDEEWHKVIAVNLSGAFFMAQAAARHMIERGTGRIVNVSSVIGETGNIGQVNYAASKSGLFGLTKSLAREVVFELNRAQRPAGDGIGLTVNAVTPGFIETGMLATVPDKVLDRLRAQIPVGRLGGPRGDRPGGLLPGRRRLVLYHRADLGRQRRPGHVREEQPCQTCSCCPASGPRSASTAAAWPPSRPATWPRRSSARPSAGPARNRRTSVTWCSAT